VRNRSHAIRREEYKVRGTIEQYNSVIQVRGTKFPYSDCSKADQGDSSHNKKPLAVLLEVFLFFSTIMSIVLTIYTIESKRVKREKLTEWVFYERLAMKCQEKVSCSVERNKTESPFHPRKPDQTGSTASNSELEAIKFYLEIDFLFVLLMHIF